MDVNESDLLSLLKTLKTLKPYLGDIVVVGGWVPFLYRRYGAIPSRHPAVRTVDIDIAVPHSIPDGGRPTIDDLLSKAGYTTRIYGSNAGAVKYELSTPPTELEFITPETGKSKEDSIFVQSGLIAQSLRYLDIPLNNFKQIMINEHQSGLIFSATIKIPTLAAFVFQKALTAPLRRNNYKEAKDLYYIFDLLDSTEDLRSQIPAEIKTLKEKYPSRWFSTAIKNLEKYFPEAGGEGAALVASQYTGPMNSETFRNYVQRVFRDMIEQMQ